MSDELESMGMGFSGSRDFVREPANRTVLAQYYLDQLRATEIKLAEALAREEKLAQAARAALRMINVAMDEDNGELFQDIRPKHRNGVVDTDAACAAEEYNYVQRGTADALRGALAAREAK